MRFYYNPVIKKLEPIGFDGFTESGVFDWHKNAFLGAYRSSALPSLSVEPQQYLFQDIDFNERYCHYLHRYSATDYIGRFLDNINADLIAREDLIRKEIPNYKYNKGEIFKTGRRIRSALQASNDVSIKAYEENCDGTTCKISITNYHPVPLLILGSSSNKEAMDTPINQKLVNSNNRYRVQEYQSITIPKDHSYIYFKVAGLDSIYTSLVKTWPRPDLAKTPVKLDEALQIPLAKDDYTTDGQAIRIKKGNHSITSPLIIPKEHNLILDSGCQISLGNNAYIVSYGTVAMNGTVDNPVIITSTTGKNQGVHIISAKEESSLSHVRFDNLNTLSEGSWQMTGAVTFYESPVSINNVTISNNQCEDALNTIRTTFDIHYLHINNTFADGFDADFCKGDLTDSRFVNTGNDGIDFSGSQVKITNVSMDNIGDKGISAGEQAWLLVNSADIDKAVIGVASKDLSIVDIKSIFIKNCNKGFAAYQKKTEYGPGKINVDDYTEESVDFLTLVEDKSEINLPLKQ